LKLLLEIFKKKAGLFIINLYNDEKKGLSRLRKDDSNQKNLV